MGIDIVRKLTGRAMCVAIFVSTISVVILSDFFCKMEHSKLTQHAEICIFHIQGKNVSESENWSEFMVKMHSV